MGRKRKQSDRGDSDRLLRGIKKLEKKFRKRRRTSYSESSRSSYSRSRSVTPEPRHYYYDLDKSDSPIQQSPVSDETSIIIQNENQVINDEAQPSTSTTPQANDNTNKIIQLDEDIPTLLGDAPKDESPTGKDTHSDISTRLQEVMINGLKNEVKEKITEEYPIPGNGNFFKAPILNPEIKAAVSDVLQKKDASLAARQGQIGVALTALTMAMDELIKDKNNQPILKHISNAARLLCDSHHIDTKIRRIFLISTLNNKLKDTLKESKHDKYLFGEELPEKLKATKAITKTSQDLRPYRPKSSVAKNTAPSSTPNNLNCKHPQSNLLNAHRKPLTNAPYHRTAGNSVYHQQRNETTRKPTTSSSRANRSSAPYKHHKRN